MRQTQALADVVGAFYEAAMLPDLWPGVISRIADLAGCSGGVIFAPSRDGLAWISSADLAPLVERFVGDGWMERNERADGLIARSATAFLSDHDVFTDAQMAEMPVYRDFLRPLGYGWGAATHIRTLSGEGIVLSLERRLDRGPVGRRELATLNDLRPHLARAANLAARLRLQKAEAALEVMERAGVAAAVMGASRQVLATNAAFDALCGQIASRAFGRIALNDRNAEQLLQSALAALSQGVPPRPASIAVPRTEDSPALVLHVLPIWRSARDLLPRADILLVASAAERAPKIDRTVLCELYDLTAAEAAVAASLLEGLSLAEIAGRRGVTGETVRGQVKRVLAKTGSHSQADFVRRLAPLVF